VPGPQGIAAALIAEIAIAFGLMTVILLATNTPKLMRLTGVFAGCLVALYITFEAPVSGMSMNPARTLASALPGGLFDALWIYFVGPAAGMLLAVETYRLIRRTPEVICAKLNHHTHRRCIFRCGYAAAD
jgi:aquaporin Z